MARTEEPAWLRAEREFDAARPADCTVADLFEAGAQRHTDEEAQRYKGGVYERTLAAAGAVPAAPDGEFLGLSYGEMRSLVRNLAAGFRDLGLGADDRVAVYANTRMEWAQADFALLAAGCVVTTAYTESGPDQLRYLLDDPGASAVVVENESLLETLLSVEDDLDLEQIVVIDRAPQAREREDVHTLGEVHDRGAEAFDLETYEGWLEERGPADLATLVYTSGTTGDPKGVRLSHRNLRTNVSQVHRRFRPRPDKDPDRPTLDADSVAVSFLPLAHIFERLSGHFALFPIGATVAYAESPDTLVEDLPLIRPTTGASVPRVYERIYEGIREQAGGSAVSERVFEWAAGVARRYAVTEDPGQVLRLQHALADRLVYSTVRERMGGNLEFMVSGGGSLGVDLARLFVGMGITVVEGYGLTETSPVVSVNPLEDLRPGTLGHPVVGAETRLDDTVIDPEEFDATGEVGELLVRGDNVTDGYWENPEASAEAFTDGWFRTGDVVERTADGYLRFKERLKQLLVLSTGKNVAPGPIEDAFATSDRVAQIMVVGDDRKFVGALIVPDFEALSRWADRQGYDLPADRGALCDHGRVRAWVQEAVDGVNRSLGATERIKRFQLVPEEWTAENDMLTPSMKKKRRNIRAAHADRVDRIYSPPPGAAENDGGEEGAGPERAQASD